MVLTQLTYRLYSMAIETLAAAVFIIPLFMLLQGCYVHKRKRTAYYVVFALYLSVVYAETGLPTIKSFHFSPNINLIPFKSIRGESTESILNVLLFVPLGFLLPFVWTPFQKFANTFLFGVGVSFTIEILQLLTFRATDINDIITNGVGTIIGYCFAAVWLKVFPKIHNIGKATDIVLLVAVTVFVMAFPQPAIVSLILKVIQ